MAIIFNASQMFKLARHKNTCSTKVTWFRWWWRWFLCHHRCSFIIGHGAGGDAALTASLAVGGLSAAWRVLLLTLFLLSLTLLFIFTDVPAEAKVRNKGSPPHWTQSKHLFRRSEWAEHRVTNADTVSICEFLTCYDVLVFHNRSSHRSQNHFCTVLCVHRKVKNPVFFHN